MIKLAITGNIASGKSLAEKFFESKGISVIDTDEIVHNLLHKDKTVIAKVTALFGQNVLGENGEINRKKVAGIVFGDKNKLTQLEKILHPEVKNEVDRFFEAHKSKKIVAVSVPQLYETGWEVYFDRVLLVTSDENTRLKRLMARNNISQEEAEIRIKSQLSQEEKLKKADFSAENSSTQENFFLQLEEIWENL